MGKKKLKRDGSVNCFVPTLTDKSALKTVRVVEARVINWIGVQKHLLLYCSESTRKAMTKHVSQPANQSAGPVDIAQHFVSFSSLLLSILLRIRQ